MFCCGLLALKALLISSSLQPLHLGQTVTASDAGQKLLFLQEDEPIAVIELETGAKLTWHGKEPATLEGSAHLWLKQPLAMVLGNQKTELQAGENCIQNSQVTACQDHDSHASEAVYFAALPPSALDAPGKAPSVAELSEQSSSDGAAVEQSACLDGGDSGEASSVDQQETSDLSNQDVQLRIEVRFP